LYSVRCSPVLKMVRSGNRQLKSQSVKKSTSTNKKQLPAASPDLSNATSNASQLLSPVPACNGCGVIIIVTMLRH